MKKEEINKIMESKINAAVLSVDQTSLGENNYNYIVQTESKKFLFKVFKTGIASSQKYSVIYDFLDGSETEIPKVINYGTLDNGSRYEIQEFVEGKTTWDMLLDEEIEFEEYVKLIARSLNEIHSIIPNTELIDAFGFKNITLRGYLQQLINKVESDLPENDQQQILDTLYSQINNIDKNIKLVPSLVHGDPAPDNLMVSNNGKSYLIDWDNSKIGDPLEDYAFLLHRGAYFRHFSTPEHRNSIIRNVFKKYYTHVDLDAELSNKVVRIYINLLELRSRLKS